MAKLFAVQWSKRGHWFACADAGATAGKGNGEIEGVGDSPAAAISDLYQKLLLRRDNLQKKVYEIEMTLAEIRSHY